MISGLTWGAPLFLWAAVAVLVGLVAAFALDFTRRQRQLARAGHSAMLERMIGSLSRGRRVIKIALAVSGCSLAVAALARPQVPGRSRWRQRGIDIVAVMDFSKSMLARDVYPSRYERTVIEVDDLLAQLQGDRVAVVAFAGVATHFPLTHDTSAVRLLYRGLTPGNLPPGSNISAAVLAARCLVLSQPRAEPGCEEVGGRGDGGAPLRSARNRHVGARGREAPADSAIRAKAIIVFTDGEQTDGEVVVEVRRAAELGIHVYFVGVGTAMGELIPELDEDGNELGWKKQSDDSFVTTRLDERALLELAREAGGEDHYYRVDPRRRGVEGLVAELDKLKKGDLDERVVRTPVEAYHWLLFPAFMLLLVEACLSDRRRLHGAGGR